VVQQPAPQQGSTISTRGKGGHLGPFLCWAVVFADIGTSVYYTPGILYGQPSVCTHAALFVALNLLVFVLLARTYGEVAVRSLDRPDHRTGTGLLLDPVVECDRVAEQLRDVGIGPQLSDQSRSVPS